VLLATAVVVAVAIGGILSATAKGGSDGPDWSQFIPDLLSGGVVAGVIALAVLRAESNRAKSEARLAAMSDWLPIKSRLVYYQMPRPLGTVNHSLLNLGADLEEWLKIIQNEPIERWAIAAPEQDDLRLLAELRTQLPLFLRKCVDLYDAVGEAWIAHLRGAMEGQFVERMRRQTERALLGFPVTEAFLDPTEMGDHFEVMRNPDLLIALADWGNQLIVVRRIERDLRQRFQQG
jgi:hypothetical protein